jgi:hypothetical protein
MPSIIEDPDLAEFRQMEVQMDMPDVCDIKSGTYSEARDLHGPPYDTVVAEDEPCKVEDMSSFTDPNLIGYVANLQIGFEEYRQVSLRWDFPMQRGYRIFKGAEEYQAEAFAQDTSQLLKLVVHCKRITPDTGEEEEP